MKSSPAGRSHRSRSNSATAGSRRSADWLTAAENPLFARVAVNRLWQWHFGEGLQKTPSDFGELGGTPANPRLLDWLAVRVRRAATSA